MVRRLLVPMLVTLTIGMVSAAEPASDDALWSALRLGGHIVLIRHAVTDPGIGDPPGFTIGNCSTQRNLSAKGRADAKRIGDAFRSRDIPITDVLSSRWCRCIDTAQLAFGRVKPASMLDSMFNDKEKPAEEKMREVFAAVARHKEKGNLILVTHAQNIQSLTGVSPSSGEMVVVKLDGPRNFKLIGRIEASGS